MSAKEENIVVWEKWIDPLFTDDIEEEEEDYEEDYDSNRYSEKKEDDHKQNNILNKQKNILITPMGVIPYDDNTSAGKIFNFWIAHTNFTIDKTIVYMIESSVGVETLDVYTRYRFRIGVGKAFSDSQIMREINNTLYTYLSENYNDE